MLIAHPDLELGINEEFRTSYSGIEPIPGLRKQRIVSNSCSKAFADADEIDRYGTVCRVDNLLPSLGGFIRSFGLRDHSFILSTRDVI